MSYEDETMVEDEDLDTEADDALPEDVEEDEDDSGESLESLDDDEEGDEEPEQPEEQSTSEPGWIKQRVNKAVQKAVAETERRMQAEFDRQMAPIREKLLMDEAKDLVRQGEFKTLERAEEYLRLKQGLPYEQEPVRQEQPRNEQGQFAPKEDPATTARIDMLAKQANRIKAKTGIDVIAEFNSNEEVKQAIISGEKDFYEVAEELQEMQSRNGRRPPAPMRSPNGASGSNTNAIDSMSDEQFEKLERRIREGARYTLR